jgi:hypothetical protein
MNKKQFINVTLAALFACPISSVANTYSFYPVDEVPIVVHGPHRLFQYSPVVEVEYDNHNGTVGIRFCQTLMNVSVLIYKNGVGTMNYSVGNAPAGSEYVMQLDNNGNTEGMVLYVVSAGKVVAVNNLD